ncbi:hypothetical protein Pan216_32520 [Planctomycetes bacterium Pan216]|uniref:HEAT repeat protein n=1 Tax=Kolteria novifilia TaxID=2527975 RepID=A0A518B5Z0_9BACT|nr:hypothetical protein Pan216_32520 [Planctomycetes bacterium Pan216]
MLALVKYLLVPLIVSIVALFLIAWFGGPMDILGIDTVARRKQASSRLKALKDEFLANPNKVSLRTEIEESTRSRYRFERLQALSTLGLLGEHASPSIPILVEALKSRDSFVTDAAARAFLDLGPNAAPAKLELATALRVNVRNSTGLWAAEALGNIGDSSPEILDALKYAVDADSMTKDKARKAYRRITGESL